MLYDGSAYKSIARIGKTDNVYKRCFVQDLVCNDIVPLVRRGISGSYIFKKHFVMVNAPPLFDAKSTTAIFIISSS